MQYIGENIGHMSVFFLECAKMYYQDFQKNTFLGIIPPKFKILEQIVNWFFKKIRVSLIDS